MRRSLASITGVVMSIGVVLGGASLADAWSVTSPPVSVATFGSAERDRAHSVAVDGAGNIFATGTFRGTVDFDPGPGTSEQTAPVGQNAVYVLKLDAAGAFQWVRSASVAIGSEYPSPALAVDPSGNVVVVGTYRGTVDFDPGGGSTLLEAAGNYEAFVWKLSTEGDLVWVRTTRGVVPPGGGPGGESFDGATIGASDGPGTGVANSTTTGSSIDIGSNGDITIGGAFRDTVDFDPDAATSELSSPSFDAIFVWRVSASGLLLWAKSMGRGSYDYPYDVAVDSNGHAFVTGPVYGTADYDPGTNATTLTSAGSNDAALVKLDSSGGLMWATLLGGASNDYSWGVDVDSSNNVVVVGKFSSTVDFDPGAGTASLVAGGPTDAFVVRLDPTGVFSWARSIGSIGNEEAFAVAVSGGGDVYVTGAFNGTVDLDPGAGTTALTSAGSEDVFLWGLSPSGNLSLARRAGGTSSDSGYAVAIAGNGALYVAGDFEGTAQFTSDGNTASVASNGDVDGFVWQAAEELADTTASTTVVTTSTAVPAVTTTVVPSTSTTVAPRVPPVVRVNRSTSAKSIATYLKMTVASTSKLSLKVSSSTARFCRVSGSSLRGSRVGNCRVTVTVKPKRGRSVSKTVTLKVTR